MTPTERKIRDGEAEDLEDELRARKLLPLVERAARETGATVREVCGHDRPSYVVIARHRVWIELSAMGWSANQIGRLWRHADHSTITRALTAAGLVSRKGVQRPAVQGAELPDG